jgi:dipeptidyl aminopeptidase/acylaminoacyl peptidase/uncharacterized Ntn-hydrolase superfamily protein
MKRLLLAVLILLAIGAPRVAAADGTPTIRQMLNLKWPMQVRISPDGRYVAYVVQEANWEENAFESQVWIANPATGQTYQLTRGKKSSREPRWSPDGKRLAFISDRGGEAQLYLISPSGGEGVALTNHETAVSRFEWSPNGKQIAFAARDPEPKERKEREKNYGAMAIHEGDYLMTHLWRIDVPPGNPSRPVKATRLTKGEDFSVSGGGRSSGFAWSPDGKRIAFTAARTPAFGDIGTQDIYVVNLADNAITRLVDTPGPDRNPVWSPDGKEIAYETTNGRAEFFWANSYIAVLPAEGGKPRLPTGDFDESASLLEWTKDGIWFAAQQKTDSYLYRLDPGRPTPARIGKPNALPFAVYSFAAEGRQVAFLHAGPNEMPEVYVWGLDDAAPKRLTALGEQLRDFRLATREVIRWQSTDGTPIEGVLSKPPDFDPSRKHPLLVVIHGGPTAADTPSLPRPFAYPLQQFAAKGALILQPNYRGSTGYGEKFRSLNVRNLGLGDYADVISGVDHLIGQGLVDRERVGAMGWSQGGYISAFITCYSDRFKAVSVGAGISDWRTYYTGTDIPPWARTYLKATPWSDPEIYRKTAPVTYLDRAKTPTLIQHGDRDERVPIANGYELYRGLKDRGVPVKLVVYKGHDHGVYKPKEQQALMEQNFDWFCEHLWGEKPAPRPAAGTAAPKMIGDVPGTFSILGYDPETGEVGGAVQSRVFSVGNGVLWAEADAGVVATQAIVDVSYGPRALALLRSGTSPDQVVKQIWDTDPDPRPQDWSKQGRQFAVMNARGEAAAFSGPKAPPWAGHKLGKFCSAQGNILAGEEVVDAMVGAFEKTQGHLSARLVAALEAGQAAGGDKRGMQSAALLIVKKGGGVWLNNDVVLRLQVDDHAAPIKELRRLVEKAAEGRR